VYDGGKNVDRESIFWLSSMSKLITTFAILRCISQGMITLDEDVTPFLPELASLPILGQSEEGKLETKPRTTPITIRFVVSIRIMADVPKNKVQAPFDSPKRLWPPVPSSSPSAVRSRERTNG
jgi:CubicO group peptidase (beta-lactamase class C family)